MRFRSNLARFVIHRSALYGTEKPTKIGSRGQRAGNGSGEMSGGVRLHRTRSAGGSSLLVTMPMVNVRAMGMIVLQRVVSVYVAV